MARRNGIVWVARDRRVDPEDKRMTHCYHISPNVSERPKLSPRYQFVRYWESPNGFDFCAQKFQHVFGTLGLKPGDGPIKVKLSAEVFGS